MQVIAGKYKNRRIATNKLLRPTSGMVRGAVFNIIMHNDDAPPLVGARVMDLFCGSGAIGIEALSRGAKQLTAVDVDTGCVSQNTKVISEDLSIIQGDLAAQPSPLAQIPKNEFDIVFMDPPYKEALHLLTRVLVQLNRDFNHLVHQDTVFIVEMPKHIDVEDLIKHVNSELGENCRKHLLIKNKIYNRIRIAVLKFCEHSSGGS